MSSFRRRAAWSLLTSCLLLAIGVVAWNRWLKPQPQRTGLLKIGYGTFPPYFIEPPGAEPTGFAVEVLREAARRINVPVEWKRYARTADAALQRGEIDLFPMLALIPERIGKLEFSAPWWENTLVVVSRKTAPIRTVEDTGGKRIALLHASFGLPRMRALFPAAVAVPEKQYAIVMDDLCSGKADGALLETRLASGLSLLPQCAGVDLTMAWLPALNLTYGVGARPGMKPEADRLHAEIIRMAQDGTMTKIGEPFGIQVTNQKQLLDSLVAGEVREQWWRDVLIGACLLLMLAGWQSYRLRVARRKAEDALAARSEFVANISHEIRTPLNGLLGMTQILRETTLDASQRECAEILDSSGQTLLALINQLLDFSKLEAGKLQLESLAFSPVRIAGEVVQLFNARASLHGVLLTCEPEPGVAAAVLGDPIRIRQILSNLVGNAVKFTSRGSIRLRVLPVAGAGRQDWVRFEVIDTGCGVDAASAERIFQPFTQVDGSTSRKHGGTGLGLAICKNLTTILGGKIGMQSEVGAGSTFWVEFPFQSAGDAVLVEPAVPTAEPGQLGMHLLVAEDNTVNQHVMTAHLKKLGCTWKMTANGREAVEAARQERYDAILMDGQMPELDGFEAARQIRRLPAPYNTVPIIAVTACAFEEDKRRCLEAGMRSVLTKPFNAAGLRAELESVRQLASPGP